MTKPETTPNAKLSSESYDEKFDRMKRRKEEREAETKPTTRIKYFGGRGFRAQVRRWWGWRSVGKATAWLPNAVRDLERHKWGLPRK